MDDSSATAVTWIRFTTSDDRSVTLRSNPVMSLRMSIEQRSTLDEDHGLGLIRARNFDVSINAVAWDEREIDQVRSEVRPARLLLAGLSVFSIEAEGPFVEQREARVSIPRLAIEPDFAPAPYTQMIAPVAAARILPGDDGSMYSVTAPTLSV